MKTGYTKKIHKKLKVPMIMASALIASLAPGLAWAINIGSGAIIIGGGGGGIGFGGGGDAGGIAEALCTIVGWFTEGGVGAAIASLAVIFLGIGAFFGKVTWGMALMFAAGIFAIFGAGEIVAAIVPMGMTSCF